MLRVPHLRELTVTNLGGSDRPDGYNFDGEAHDSLMLFIAGHSATLEKLILDFPYTGDPIVLPMTALKTFRCPRAYGAPDPSLLPVLVDVEFGDESFSCVGKTRVQGDLGHLHALGITSYDVEDIADVMSSIRDTVQTGSAWTGPVALSDHLRANWKTLLTDVTFTVDVDRGYSYEIGMGIHYGFADPRGVMECLEGLHSSRLGIKVNVVFMTERPVTAHILLEHRLGRDYSIVLNGRPFRPVAKRDRDTSSLPLHCALSVDAKKRPCIN
jgi:hypothetical protein